jgi:triphosphoribosyl-dephospho-CoA synthase
MTTGGARASAIERARASFLCACELDVAVRKPGNVSRASAGHGMRAVLFSASALASVEPLFEPGARVGERIEAAVEATWAVAGCNTNLGILLLCAPIARAVEQCPEATEPGALREAIGAVLGDLDLADTRAAYRAIAKANPGGLGSAEAEDVHDAPSRGLRAAMALAADRDRIARQYRDGYRELFEVVGRTLGGLDSAAVSHCADPGPALTTAVHRVYLELLATAPDSHIVRKHGDALAHTVMSQAQPWAARAAAGIALGADIAFTEWDLALKAAAVNPGTSADLTVAALLIAGITGRIASPA